MLRYQPPQFLEDPIGHYCAGRSYLVFCQSPTLRGHVVWGVPTVEEMTDMVQLLQVAARPGDTPYRWYVDLSELSSVEARNFGLMVDFVYRNREQLRTNVQQLAQVRPSGMLGAIIAGFAHIAGIPYMEGVFESRSAALAWLGLAASEAESLQNTLDDIRRDLSQEGSVVALVRAQLARNSQLGVEAVASRLGLSVRQLQRELGEQGTSFREEARYALTKRAQQLLADPTQKVSSIAMELGFSTPQHFATAFRQATGETPTAWRHRHNVDLGSPDEA